MSVNTPNDIYEKLSAYIDSKSLIKILLSNRRDKQADLKNIIITIVQLKKGLCLNFVYRHATKDITKNYDIQEGLAILKNAVENDFYNMDIYTQEEDIHLLEKENGKVQLKINVPTMNAPVTFSHDKIKRRPISIDSVYLKELGITNATGELRREMGDKYKQLNKYIELLEPYLTDKSMPDSCKIADMGSGKGYLTFALYDFITNSLHKKAEVVGVEYREELVALGNNVAKKCNFDKLQFIQGTIEKTEIEDITILIALHACDTATDDAIYRGIKAGSSLIVCAPCCHKQLRKEFAITGEYKNIMKYGILEERQAELVTDGLRAMYLEAFGYKTNVVQFIATEHTPKNVMIIGEKISNDNIPNTALLKEIALVKNMFGIKKHYLETLLEKDYDMHY